MTLSVKHFFQHSACSWLLLLIEMILFLLFSFSFVDFPPNTWTQHSSNILLFLIYLNSVERQNPVNSQVSHVEFLQTCSKARATQSAAYIFNLPSEILCLEPAQVYYWKSITKSEAVRGFFHPFDVYSIYFHYIYFHSSFQMIIPVYRSDNLKKVSKTFRTINARH